MMNWREILNTKPMDIRDKRAKRPLLSFSPFSPLNRELKNTDKCLQYKSLYLDHLTDTERKAIQEYIEIMTSPRFNMPLDKAESEAFQLVTKNRRYLEVQQARADYRRNGYIKIYSTVLGQAVYLAKDERKAKQVPDQSLPAFTEGEIRSFKGLCPEEAKLLLEAKIIFYGTIW